MFDLNGKVSIVTGAGSGIGAATARMLAKSGSCVMVTDIRLDAAQSVADEISAVGGTAKALACDVEQEEHIQNMVSCTVKEFGRLDILHNNAALLDPIVGEKDEDVLSIDSKTWDRVMAVNVRGVMLGCKYSIPQMKLVGGGAIVNTASTYGMRAYANMCAYSTSKAAIIQLTRMVATSFGRDNIRCNAVAPALTRTEAMSAFSKEAVDMAIAASAVGALAAPLDLAFAVAFLVSDAAKFITGHVLPVDGGVMAQLATAPGGRQLRFAESIPSAAEAL